MSTPVKLTYDDGYKTIELNGDPQKVIRINPTDTQLLDRISSFNEKADSIKKKYGDIDMNSIEKLQTIDEKNPDFEIIKKAAENADKLDKAIKELIDEIFGYDISSIVFGASSCLSPAGGKPVFLNFMTCIFEYIKECSAEERKKSTEALNAYAAQRDMIVMAGDTK